MAEKTSPGTRQTDGKNLVWFGEIERNFANLSMPTFTYHYSNYFMHVTVGIQGYSVQHTASTEPATQRKNKYDMLCTFISLFSLANRTYKRTLNAHPPQVPEGGLVLEHVAEELLHGRGADGLLEVDALHVGGGHGLQRGEGQQQPGEPRALRVPSTQSQHMACMVFGRQ
jgi:hypothetical protein